MNASTTTKNKNKNKHTNIQKANNQITQKFTITTTLLRKYMLSSSAWMSLDTSKIVYAHVTINNPIESIHMQCDIILNNMTSE
jgi:hypothetical protein